MTEHATTPSTPRQLHRSRSDRYVAGVCGGLAEYFDLHPAFFRVGFVVLALLGGSGLLAYVAAVLVIPDEGRTDSIAADALRDHRDRPWAAIGLGLIALAGLLLLSHATFWPNGDISWGLLLAAGIVILWAQRRDHAAAPGPEGVTRPRRFPLGVAALGAHVAGAGVLGLLDAAGIDIRWDIAAGVGAVLLGIAATAAAFLRQPVVGLLTLGILLGATAVAAATIDVRVDRGIGDRTFHPASLASLRHEYRLGIGDLTVDLSNVQLPPGDTRVDTSLGIGDLTVTVPQDVTVRVDGSVALGDSEVLGASRENAVDEVPGSDRTLVLHAEVGLGRLEVRRAVR
jgi:phage shock protein PspC (stress-responsive transcriptional regulator)